MFQYHAINPIALEIGPFSAIGPLKVHWYGIMYLVAFAAAWWLGRVRAAKPGSTWTPADIDDFMFFGMLGTILGGRIGYVLFYGLSFWTAEDPWYPIKVWDGGMSFHGGLLGVLIAFAIFAVRRGRRIADVFDFAAPLPGIGICAVRIGNFINGELWGKPTDVPWAVVVDGDAAARHAAVRGGARRRAVVHHPVVVHAQSRGRAWRPRDCSSSSTRCRASRWNSGACPTHHLNYLLGTSWVTMGMLLSLPMLLIGLTLVFMAYRRREPSGNFVAAPQPA